jgi:L-arabinonolactonase
MRIDTVIDVKTSLGESPIWDAEQERLYFVDSVDGRIFRVTADGREIQTWDVREKIGSMCLRRDGDAAIVALQSGLYSYWFDEDALELLHAPEADLPNNRLNDGKADSAGRFVVGSMGTQEQAASGKLYRLDPDLSLTVLDTGIVCSNGPCFSPDERTGDDAAERLGLTRGSSRWRLSR